MRALGVLLLLACLAPVAFGEEEGQFLVLQGGKNIRFQSYTVTDEGYEVIMLDGSVKSFKSSEAHFRFVSKATEPRIEIENPKPMSVKPLPVKQIEKPKENKVKYLLRGPEPVRVKPPT